MSHSALGYLNRQYYCVLLRCRRLNAAVMAGAMMVPAFAAQADAIVPDGRTQTQLSVNGAVTDIRTQTIRGNNAFNSFSRFNVEAGNTVNLHLPGQTSNLLNLVHGEQTYINGLVNAYKGGRIGGNVYFFNPYGVIVGAQGVLNVGSLTIATPTGQFMNQLLDTQGGIDDTALNQALAGQIPLSASGLISVKGHINAADAVTLAGGNVDIDAGARILAGAQARIAFNDLVNVEGVASATKVEVDGGIIHIVAAEDIKVAGQVSADGLGAKANGGEVTIKAERDAKLMAGGRVTANAGTTGDGGFVEFSAKNTVELAGGNLQAAAANGVAGSILIDPANLVLSSDLLRNPAGNSNSSGVTWDAGSLTLQVDNNLTLADGVLLSTRQVANQTRNAHINDASIGDSGNLTLKAAHIDLGKDSLILANADHGFQSGDVLIKATHINAIGADRTADASIKGERVTIRGRDVTISATADTSLITQLLEQTPNITLADAQAYLNTELDSLSDGPGGEFLALKTKATAKTELYGATIAGSGKVSISASAGARAGFDKNATADVIIGDSLAADGTTVLASSDIRGNTLSIKSTADTSLTYNVLGNALRLADQSWLPDPNNGILKLLNDTIFDFSSVPLVSLSSATAHTTINGSSKLRATDTLTLASSAISAAKPTFAGLVVFSAGWGDSSAEAKTVVGGSSELHSTNKTSVTANTDADVNVTATVNSINKPIDAVFSRAISRTVTVAEVGDNTLTEAGSVDVLANTKVALATSAVAQNTGGSGVGFAVGVSQSTTDTTATLGGDVTANIDAIKVDAKADISKNSTGAEAATLGSPSFITEKITNPIAAMQRNVTSGILNATGKLKPGTATRVADFLFPGIKEGKFNLSGAVTYTEATNNATASIAPNARVKAVGDLSVTSSITDRPNASVGAKSTSTGTAVGGSAVIASFTNNANAYLGKNSTVDAKGALLVDAQTVVPYPWAIDWQNPVQILNYLQGGILDMGLTSYAINSAKGKSGVGLAAAVSVFGLNNSANAWIDEGAKVNTIYDKDTLALPDQSVNVHAKNDINSVNAVGLLSKTFLGTSGGKAAIGGSANIMDITENSSATIRGNANVKSETTVDVKAENIDRLITVTEAGGSSDQVGIEGAVSINTIKGGAIAAIDDDAKVNAGSNVNVEAISDLKNITVAGGVVATKGQVGIGFSVSINSIDTNASAYIGNYDPLGLDNAPALGEVKSAADLSVKATSKTEIGAYSVTGAIATSSKAQTDVPADAEQTQDAAGSASSAGSAAKGKFGIAVSGDASVNDIKSDTLAYIADGAKVSQAHDAKLNATNTLAINALAGAVTISTQGDGNGLAGSYAQNTMTGTTSAYLDHANLSLTGDLGLTAEVNGEINSLSASVQGSKGKVGVAGAVSVNNIGNTTKAYVKGSSVPDVNLLNLLAKDTSAIHSVAGAASFGGKVGIGLSFAWNKLDNTTDALVDTSGLYADGNISVQTLTDNDIQTISAAIGASQGGMAGAGAVSVNTINNKARATANNSTLDSTTGSVELTANDSSTIFSIAGSAAISGGQASVGVALAYNDINNITEAKSSGDSLSGNNVTLEAGENADIQAIAVGGSGSAKVAVTGSLGINAINNTTTASAAGTSLNTAGNVKVHAKDISSIQSITGAAAVGGNGAVGASGSYNHIGGAVKAEISGGLVTAANVLVDAERAGTLDVWAVSGSGAGTAGISGSIALNDAGGSTTARIGEAAEVSATGNALVTAEADDLIKSKAGALGVGGTLGGAGAIAFNDIHADTRAEVTGANTKVSAQGAGGTAQVDNGVLGNSGTLAARQQKDALRGVAVVASSTSQVENYALSAAGGGNAAVAGTVSIALMGGTTTSEVSNGAVLNTSFGNAEQEARVAAYHHDDLSSITGGGAIGGDAGLGGAVDTQVVSHTTTAKVDGATVQAKKNVVLDAASSSEIAQAVVAVGGGTYAGLAGTGGVVLINGTTQTLANNAHLNAKGEIKAEAKSNTKVDIKAGALAVSGVAGVGITAAVTVVEQNTRAIISGNSQLNANGATSIHAASDFNQTNYAYTAAAAGGVGVAGTVNVVVVKGSTDAEVGGGVTINADTAYGSAAQDVNISASDKTKVTNKVGSLGIGLGGVGVGAVADVVLVHNGASARVDSGANITAENDITVSANSERDVSSISTAMAGGYTAGIAGAVSVISVGARPEGDAKDNTSGSVGKAGELSSSSAVGDQMGSDSSTADSRNRANTARSGIQLNSDFNTVSANSSAAATVTDATLHAGRHVDVSAHNKTNTDAIAVGAAISGGVSLGGGIAIAMVDDKTVASLTGNTTAGGNVQVKALDDQPDVSLMRTYAGGAGLAGLAASFAWHEKSSTATATLGGTVTASHGSVTVDAGIAHNLEANGGAGAAGVVGVGAAMAYVTESGTAEADVNDGTHVTAQSLDVHGHSQTTSIADVTAAAGGLISGAGADANVKDTSSAKSSIGDNAVIRTAGGLTQVHADVDPLAKAKALGASVSASVSIGVSLADALVETKAEAKTGDHLDVQANAMTVQAETKLRSGGKTAESDAIAAAGGLLAGASASESNATAHTSTVAELGSNNIVNVTGELKVAANSVTNADADVTGISLGGYLAAGSSKAKAKTDTMTTAQVDDNPDLTAASVRVKADGNDTLRANTVAGAGGLGVLVASKAETEAISHTTARLGGATGTSGTVDAALVEVAAAQHTNFNSTSDSTSASVVGYSGARALNNVTTDTRAILGQYVTVNTQDFSASAWNNILKPALASGYNVDSGSGGLLNAAAARSESFIRNSALVDIEHNAEVDVAKDDTATGNMNLSVLNEVTAYDRVRLDSGGAIAIAKAESEIQNDRNDALVHLGTDATLLTDGEANLSARAVSLIHAAASSKTYGLAGAAEGSSVAGIAVNNRIELASGAKVEAEGDVHLMAGTDRTHGNDLYADAETRLWNRTAIPIETDPDAHGQVVQHNTIDIADGAQARSVKNIFLTATEGSHRTRGFGEGTDLYREILAAIAEFFGADSSSLKITGGSTYDNANLLGGLDPASGVNVDGIVQAGIWHHQFLTLAADGSTVTSSEGMKDRWRLRNNVNLATELSEEIAKLTEKANDLRADANSYAGSDATTAAQALENDAHILEQQLAALNDASPVGFIDILDTTALTGNVNISGKYLTGLSSGKIEAPGDVRIDIENQSTRFMQTATLTIPDEGGGQINFNGLRVSTNADINQRNAVGKTATIGTLLDAVTSPKPVIRVENTNDADSPSGAPAQLWMRGDVNNLGGEAIAKSHGTLRVSANINAETVNIATGGDFIKTYTPGFTHQGGDPVAQLGSLPNTREAAKVDYSQNDLTQNCGVGGDGCSTTIAGNNVYISGEKLNINGLIQAGLPDRLMVIDSSLTGGANASLIANARAAWLAHPDTAARYLDLNNPAPESTAIKVRYDAQYDRLELANVRMGGGHMELFGNIFSTGNGELRVMDGYGRINVSNTTGYDLAIGRLDTGPGVEGLIHITDTSQTGADGKPLVTEITRLGNNIETRNSTILDANGKPIKLVSSAAGRTTNFQPLQNRRFNWINGNRTQTDEDRVYSTRVLFGLDWLVPDYDAPDSSTSSSQYTSRATGDWLSVGGGSADYAMDYMKYTSGPYKYQNDSTNRDGVICIAGHCAYEDITTHAYFRTVVNEYYQHSLNASKSVMVNFIGFDTANLTVDAGSGQLLLGGLVRGLTGDTSLTAAAGIRQLNEDARIIANNLTLSSSAGAIGSPDRPLNIDLVDASSSQLGKLSAHARDGLFLQEIDGDLRIAQAQADNGDVTLIADRNLLADSSGVVITGNNLNLVSLSADIGSLAVPLVVETQGDVTTLSASAARDIYLQEATGDMRVKQIKSLAGDVVLSVPDGKLLDSNTVQQVDENTRDELLALWKDMRLTGDEADVSLSDNLKAQADRLKQEYEAYFRMRNLHRLDNGSYTAAAYDAHYAFHATPNQAAALRQANGWSDAEAPAKITQYEASQTAAYHSAYQRFGAGSYVVNFTPTLNATETAALSEGAKWTNAQLTNALAAGLFRPIADTEVRIEEANILGRDITLNVKNGIGNANLPSVTIVKGSTLTDEQKLVLLTAERNDFESVGNEIHIRQQEDVDVTVGGQLLATTQLGDVQLGSEANLLIDEITAPGEVRIKTAASLQGVAGKTHVTAARTILEAGSADLGSAATPILVELPDTGTLTARAGRDLFVTEKSGDMTVESVFAKGTATLNAPGAIVEAREDKALDVRAASIDLTAGDTIGRPGGNNALDVAIKATGRLDANAPNGVYLNSSGASGQLGNVTTSGSFNLNVSGGSISLIGVVNANTSVQLGADDDIQFVGGSVRSNGPVRLEAGLDGNGSILGSALAGLDVQTPADVFISAADAIGGTAPLEVSTDGRLNLQGRLITLDFKPVTAGHQADLYVSGQHGAMAQELDLNIHEAGDSVLHTLVVGNANIHTDSANLRVDLGHIGDHASFFTPYFRSRIDHLDHRAPLGMDFRAFTPNGDFNLSLTPTVAHVDAFIINQNPQRLVFGNPPGNAEQTAEDSLHRLPPVYINLNHMVSALPNRSPLVTLDTNLLDEAQLLQTGE